MRLMLEALVMTALLLLIALLLPIIVPVALLIEWRREVRANDRRT